MPVLAHLALRGFSTSPENLATEALAYILSESSAARSALRAYVNALTGRDVEVVRYATQASNDDQSRPDLWGFDANGANRMVVEVKFWAGLTDAQPNKYLAAMVHDGVVMFVTPSARIPSVWAELQRRVREAGFISAEPEGATNFKSDTQVLAVGGKILALTSWRALLAQIEAHSEASEDTKTVADVRQLHALCDQMDTEAFLPLSSEELTSSLGRRVVQFEDLADTLTNRLVEESLADVTGLRAAAAWYCSGRYLRLRGNAAYLKFDARYWSKLGASPLWLEIWGAEWRPKSPSAAVSAALDKGGISYSVGANSALVPIRLPVAVEEASVIADAMKQLRTIVSALPVVQAKPTEQLIE